MLKSFMKPTYPVDEKGRYVRIPLPLKREKSSKKSFSLRELKILISSILDRFYRNKDQ